MDPRDNNNPSHPDQSIAKFDAELAQTEGPEISPEAVELTAYLDGELEPTQAFEVEKRLNSDPSYLAEMQALQKAWDLFDRLPSLSTNNNFVRTTMELVVADASRNRNEVSKLRGWLWPGLLGLIFPIVLFLASYLATLSIRTQPHQHLAENFELIVNLDRFKRINYDLDFLERLNKLDVFSEDIAEIYRRTDDITDTDFSINDFDDRTQPALEIKNASLNVKMDEIHNRLDQLDSQQISLLRSNYDRFLQLSDDEQVRLREFHLQLAVHPDSFRLLNVLSAYDDWLKKLGTNEKHGGAATVAALLDMPVDQRLNEVLRIRSAQSREALGRIGATRLPHDRDMEVLLHWFDFSISSNQLRIRNLFPGIVLEYLNQQNSEATISREQLDRWARRQSVRQLVAILYRIDRMFIQDLIFEDVDILRQGLSYQALGIIGEHDVEEQKELILNWIDVAIQAKAIIPEHKLQEFYESLPRAKREELDQMSIEEWNSTLTSLYWEQNQNSRMFQEWESQFLGGGIFP